MVMKGDTLNDAIEWMFIHCTSQNEYCRNKCMELITDLSSKIPGIIFYSSKYFKNLSRFCFFKKINERKFSFSIFLIEIQLILVKF